MKRLLFVLVAVSVCAVKTASASPVMPSCQSFGTLSVATFGGAGIPNNAVCQGTFANNTVTLGLTVTPRFANPPVANDGAGTFTDMVGGDPGNPAYAKANFDFYGSGASKYQLFYDLDPGVGTNFTDLGVVNFGGGTNQDSWNQGFTFLRTGVPGVITPPAYLLPFNPTATGEYSFLLRALGQDNVNLGEVSILLNTTRDGQPAPVPEPASMVLLGTGLAAAFRARKKFAVSNVS